MFSSGFLNIASCWLSFFNLFFSFFKQNMLGQWIIWMCWASFPASDTLCGFQGDFRSGEASQESNNFWIVLQVIYWLLSAHSFRTGNLWKSSFWRAQVTGLEYCLYLQLNGAFEPFKMKNFVDLVKNLLNWLLKICIFCKRFYFLGEKLPILGKFIA